MSKKVRDSSSEYVVSGTQVTCSGSTAPTRLPLMVLGPGACIGRNRVLTQRDCTPLLTKTFGTCSMLPPTPAGPAPCVAFATCTLLPSALKLNVSIGGSPVLIDTGRPISICASGGSISLTGSGQ